MRIDFSVRVNNAGFGSRHAAAGVDHVRFAADFADLAPQRPRVVHLQFQRGEVAALIGERAERLGYLNCAVDRAST